MRVAGRDGLTATSLSAGRFCSPSTMRTSGSSSGRIPPRKLYALFAVACPRCRISISPAGRRTSGASSPAGFLGPVRPWQRCVESAPPGALQLIRSNTQDVREPGLFAPDAKIDNRIVAPRARGGYNASDSIEQMMSSPCPNELHPISQSPQPFSPHAFSPHWPRRRQQLRRSRRASVSLPNGSPASTRS